MGRAPCCEKVGLKRGPWTPDEDLVLMAYIHKYGHDNWRALPKHAGLLRCGKSCRLRWINYLRPDIKRGNFTPDEEETIIKLHGMLGNKWSKIAARLPGRTDNEIKNVWHTHLKKRLQPKGQDATPSPKKTSSWDSSLSTAGSSLSSLNQCDETQLKEKQTDMNHIPRLGVGKVIRTDHGKTDENEKLCALSDEKAIEIPVEPDQSDLTREMLDEGSSSSGDQEIFKKQMAEYANSSSKHHHETKSSIRHSPSFSSTTLNSYEAISSNIGQFHLMMNITPTILDGHDGWKDMNEWSDESNFADMIWDSMSVDMRISHPSDECPKSEPYDQQISSVKGGESSKEVVGGQRWVLELENELELSSASGEPGEYKSYLVKGDLVLDKPKSDSSNLSSSEEIALEFEVDPIVAYFQSLSSSPTIHL